MIRYLAGFILWSLACSCAVAQPATTRPSLTDMLAANCAATNALIGGASTPGCGPLFGSANTASALVQRDSSGNFSAGTITASLTGAASLNLLLSGGTMSGNIAMGGNNITGVGNVASTTFNGNTITTGTGTLTLAAGKTLTDTSGVGASILLGATGGGFSAYAGASACSANNFITALSAAGASTCGSSTISGVALGSNLATLTYGTHLTNSAGASSYNGSAASTLSTDATSANTASTIVARDGSGNFSAGTISPTAINSFTNNGTITGGSHVAITGLGLRDTSAAFDVTIAATSSTTLTAGRTLTLDVGNVAHTLKFGTTANTITFPNLASFTVITNGDTGTVTNAMLAGSIAASKLIGTDIATVGTLTAGATGAGFTVALTTSTITGNLPIANAPSTATNTVLGNATSGIATVTALSVSSCSTASSALQWTTNTGFGCNTSITAAAVPASGITGTTLASNVVTSSITRLGFPVGLGTAPSTNIGVDFNGTVSGNATVVGVYMANLTLSPNSGGNAYFQYAGAGAVNTGGNTINSATGALIAPYTKAGGGTITTAYGLYADTQTVGTTNWSIWSAGDVNFNAQFFVPNITTSSAAQSGTVCWSSGTGKFTADTTVGCLSSVMVAKNITERLSPEKALRIITQLDPFAFRYKQGWGDDGHYEQFGLGAEEVALIDERLVGRDPEGKLQGVRYQELTAVLAGAIQKLKADNDNLHTEIATLRRHGKR